MKKQKANAGGTLAPDEVIGRDALVERLWSTLERQSLYITAERRMGKTSIVRDKMGKTPPPGWTLIYLDVAKASTPLDFVEALMKASLPHLGARRKAAHGFQQVVNKLAGGELSLGVEIKLPERLGADWKRLLETLCRDLCEPDANKRQIVVAFDELPLMLDAIKRQARPNAGEAVAMEILDTLRAIRQEQNLRMIYTGSLGLHHVLTGLQDQGYQNAPTNDMYLVDVGPLAHEHAAELARRLFQGHAIPCDDLDGVAAHLARAMDGMAFYIQNIVTEMGFDGAPGTTDEIDRRLHARLSDPLDPWRLDYHDTRIDTHYPAAFRPIARAILDRLALQPGKTLMELTESIDPRAFVSNDPIPQPVPPDPETVRSVLRLLGLDHYLALEENRYRFRSPFMRRVWRARRGI